MSSKTTGYKLTKADFQQINRRNLAGFQAGWNYERMQHSGYLWIILPQLRKIYGDGTEALKTACRTQCSPFFNTSNFLNTIITGIDLAIEETDGLDGMETVASLKTGLMGPLASIGDSIFGSLLPTIFGALAANMAMQGNPLGIFIWIAVNIVVDWFRCKQIYIAYDQGMKLVTTMSDQLNAITDAATVMGVFMVGALISTNVGVVLNIVPDIGGVTVDVQDILNTICPKLVPAALVGFVYWLLGKKGMTSTKAILIILVIGIVLGGLGLAVKG